MINQEDKARESIIAFFLLFLCFAALILGLAFIKKNNKKISPDAKAKIVDTFMRDKIMVVPLEGVIYDSYSPTPFRQVFDAAFLRRQLNKALEDDHVKAVLLRVNSPGGTVATSQELYELVMELRKKEKAVVVSMSDVCASGCYYIASAADSIVANPGTLTGSIGVITQGLNFKGLLDKLGISDQTYKAGKYKDMASATREATEEEKAIMQKLLKDSYRQFLSDISAAREIDMSELEQLAEGLIYTGNQAKKVNLVDDIGSYKHAIEVTRDLLANKYNYKNAKKIKIEESWDKYSISGFDDIFDLGMSTMSDFFQMIGSLSSFGMTEFNISPNSIKNQIFWLAD